MEATDLTYKSRVSVLAERPLSAIEELLMEIMILQEKGAIVYASVCEK